jgi:hypothetical protein
MADAFSWRIDLFLPLLAFLVAQFHVQLLLPILSYAALFN